jgi:hypothetical protein
MKRPKKEDENKVEYGTISLPLPLIKKIKERIRGTGMNSVSAYVAFVVREILSSSKEKFVDKEEISKIKSRLKSLGY